MKNLLIGDFIFGLHILLCAMCALSVSVGGRNMKIIDKVLSLVLVTALCAAAAAPMAVSAEEISKAVPASGDSSDTVSAIASWVSESSFANSLTLQRGEVALDGKLQSLDDGVVLNAGQTLAFAAEVQEAGDYMIGLKYQPLDSLYTDLLFDYTSGENNGVASLPVLWADANSVYAKDRLGNELLPEQKAIDRAYGGFLRDYRDTDSATLTLPLAQGVQNLTLSSKSHRVKITGIYIVRAGDALSYKDYVGKYANEPKYKEMISFEAEHYNIKSDSFIRATNKKNAALTPYNTYHKMLNVLDENSWGDSGQKVLWEFSVPQDGLYSIGVRYLQNSDTDKPVYRRIEIDGSVPFSEWEAHSFINTKTGKYANTTLNVGEEPAYIYLTAGKHTIAMTATMGPLNSVYNEIVDLMDDINALGMDIQKITAGQTDQNRTWNMEYYLPNAVDDLSGFADRIDKIYENLQTIGGTSPSYADSLKYAAEQLRKLIKTPNQIPNKTSLINQGDSSATKYLGDVLEKLISSPLGIDAFFIGDTSNMPAAEPSFFTAIGEWIKAFLWSFTKEASADDHSTSTTNGKELTVWVNRSVQYVQTLQQLVDSDYNSKYGTNIQLSIMPSEQKLILSNATGSNPDVVLGAGLSTPFNLAIRGAAKNLLEYDDFLEFYADSYSLQSLVPGTLGDGVYGAAESQDFYVLFYRKDILETLGLSVPDTWDDVKTMMPALLRYGMNFFMPLSSGTGYKGFSITSPFIYQNGSAYVTDDGTASLFDSDNFIDAMKEMTNLYKIYGMSTSLPSFYNSFRSGEVPIGISTFGTYMQLQVAAPELAGKWGIALTPGTKQEDGTVVRYQPASANTCMILENTKRSDEAWRFLKWWLSTDTQARYAYLMQSRYGSEYRWNSANLEAFSQLPYSAEDREIILNQWKDQRETVNHPANYMIERESSDIWNGVVVDNEALIEEIDRATALTNREIRRKLNEFGFCDKDGNVIKEYSMTAYQTLLNKLNEKRKGEAK